MYKEATLPWLNGEVLIKHENIPLSENDFILEESSWVNTSLGISVVTSMEALPGLDPFLHVSAHCIRRDMTLEELKHLKNFFFGQDSFVKVVPTQYSKSRHRTFHLTLSSKEEAHYEISPN